MVKLVIFKLGDGNFEQGFSVALQIGEDGDRPSTEITGKLPPAPEIPQQYSCWQSAYRRLDLPSRLEADFVQVTNVSITEDCCHAVKVLRNTLNNWLSSESFRLLREKLLEKLMPSDEVRVILQAEDIRLQRLPWHLCDLFELYPKAEIALSAPAYERIKQSSIPKTKVRILAILGNSAGIDTQADRAMLEQLPSATIQFLVEPQRQELTNQLWSQGWDILFFAGHSASGANGEKSQIYINQTDSLTIGDLRYALKTAVEHGLKLAIFNSCDGLGLARELATLHIPQIIIMREPIPDKVAQEFLKYFLKAFAGGKSFYLAVREARERLQGLEDEFPCATWLPMIYQNLAEAPPTWQELCSSSGDINKRTPNGDHRPSVLTSRRSSLRILLLASIIVTSLVMGVRQGGMLQALELIAFDQTARLRPDEGPDRRLLVVAITEEDFSAPEQKQRKGSLSDRALARLLEKLEQYQPRAIGLDIYREDRIDPKYADLATRLQQSERFIGVCKLSDPSAVDDPSISPPPEIPQERQGFSDVVKDFDGILRRHLLALNPHPASPCTTPYAFSVQLAFRYLAAEGILPKWTPEGNLQLDNVIFKRLQARTGGYQPVDAAGFQVLLNYRSYRSPEDIAEKVTLRDVLSDKVKPDAIKDRIILIGVTAQSAGDYFATPYSTRAGSYQEMAGVIVHAQMVSQILSAVLNQRPLLWVWPQWGEALWVWGWSLVGGMFALRYRSILHLQVAIGAVLGVLYGLCFGLLTQGGWVPLVPSALALVATSGSVVAYSVQTQRKSIKLYSVEN